MRVFGLVEEMNAEIIGEEDLAVGNLTIVSSEKSLRSPCTKKVVGFIPTEKVSFSVL